MFYFDWTMILMLPGLLLGLWAQSKVNSTYQKYSRIPVRSGMTAAEAAERILRQNGAGNVMIQQTGGHLTDHYDPRSNVLRLSSGVCHSSSVAALGIAAHEAGHAIQQAEQYPFLKLRTAVAPVVNIGSSLSWPIFFLGFLFSWEPLMTAGIVLFSAVVLFTLITLPVEFDASRRALKMLSAGGYLTETELGGAKQVLTAAALTYVASFVSAALQLLRLLTLARRRD
ncbi:MAG: zinc metallopeptidase [Clostridiales bacterium]|nr:zinc metallopeptidase [Clostridiales bacterium]